MPLRRCERLSKILDRHKTARDGCIAIAIAGGDPVHGQQMAQSARIVGRQAVSGFEDELGLIAAHRQRSEACASPRLGQVWLLNHHGMASVLPSVNWMDVKRIVVENPQPSSRLPFEMCWSLQGDERTR